MLQTVRITSKRQITIPVKIFRQLNLNEGDNLLVEVNANMMVIKKAQSLLDELAGSVKIPKKYLNKSIDFIIKETKRKYFARKYGQILR